MGLVLEYVGSMLSYMLLAVPFYVIGRVVFIKIKNVKVEKVREVILGVFVLYIVGLASQTMIPNLHYGVDNDTGEFFFETYSAHKDSKPNFIPFNTIIPYITDWHHFSFINIVANIFIFSPIGFFVPLLWKNWQSFRKILAVGVATTFFIEFFQLFIGRSTDIDDIILNTIGVIIGYGVFMLYSFMKNQGTSTIILEEK